jgi:hypothetical protein
LRSLLYQKHPRNKQGVEKYQKGVFQMVFGYQKGVFKYQKGVFGVVINCFLNKKTYRKGIKRKI